MDAKNLDIVLDGPPGHESGRFVEVEFNGKSVCVGNWVPDGKLWRLRLNNETVIGLIGDQPSLRDHFACQALLGMLANSEAFREYRETHAQRARSAYAAADAMLAEREKR